MTSKQKEKWLHLYEVAMEIEDFYPWNDFAEKDRFAYIWKDKSKTVFFSFIGESAQKNGIACYVGEENYMRARARLTSKNEKNEPVFMLQNAYICLWDNRDELRESDYELIRELGFKFRGRGAWLHFDRYEIGYVPIPLEEKDVDFLTTAFENLFMMLRGIYEQGIDPKFDKGKCLVRWYEPKDKLYYTHPLDIAFSSDAITYPFVTVRDNDWMSKVRSMKSADYSVEVDWSYIDAVFDDDDEKETFPLLLLVVEKENGFVLANQLLSPSHDKFVLIFGTLEHFVDRYGKPEEIIICDDALYGILADVCGKIRIKLTQKKKLSTLPKARKEFLSRF